MLRTTIPSWRLSPTRWPRAHFSLAISCTFTLAFAYSHSNSASITLPSLSLSFALSHSFAFLVSRGGAPSLLIAASEGLNPLVSRFANRSPFSLFQRFLNPIIFSFSTTIVYVRRMHSRIIQHCSKVAWWLIWFTGETRGASYMQWSEYQDQIARSVSLGDRVTRR